MSWMDGWMDGWKEVKVYYQPGGPPPSLPHARHSLEEGDRKRSSLSLSPLAVANTQA